MIVERRTLSVKNERLEWRLCNRVCVENITAHYFFILSATERTQVRIWVLESTCISYIVLTPTRYVYQVQVWLCDTAQGRSHPRSTITSRCIIILELLKSFSHLILRCTWYSSTMLTSVSRARGVTQECQRTRLCYGLWPRTNSTTIIPVQSASGGSHSYEIGYKQYMFMNTISMVFFGGGWWCSRDSQYHSYVQYVVYLPVRVLHVFFFLVSCTVSCNDAVAVCATCTATGPPSFEGTKILWEVLRSCVIERKIRSRSQSGKTTSSEYNTVPGYTHWRSNVALPVE